MNSRTGIALAVAILLATLVSTVVINPYTYGDGDTSITIPFTKAAADPGLYPNDFLVAQRPYYFTVLWDGLAVLHTRLGIGLPALFFGAYLVALTLTFGGIALLALALFGRVEVAILSLLLVLFSHPTLAGVATIEGLLNTRGVATPILLLALFAFLHHRAVPAFALAGLAYLVHPLTTQPIVILLVVGSLAQPGPGRWWRLAAGLAIFVLIASPVLGRGLLHRPPSLHLFSADPQWLAALAARSWAHTMPHLWGWRAVLHVAITAALFGLAWRFRDLEREERNHAVRTFVVTILALCALQVVISDLRPMGIGFLLQLPRVFQFMDYLVVLYVANAAHGLISRGGWLRDVAPACGLAIGTCLRAYQPERAAMVVGTTLVFVRLLWRRRPTAPRLAALVCGAILVWSAWFFVADRWIEQEAGFAIGNDQDPAWLDVQRWARRNTGRADGFVVPPDEEFEFRVESERTVYADWEDGGLMNANPAFGIEWARRMRMLGYHRLDEDPAYDSLGVAGVLAIAREMRPRHRSVFVVWHAAAPPLALPPRYSNSDYVVYEVVGTSR